MLGNEPHVLGNGPHVLGNGPPFMHSIHEYRVILIMGRLGWFVCLSWAIGLGKGDACVR